MTGSLSFLQLMTNLILCHLCLILVQYLVPLSTFLTCLTLPLKSQIKSNPQPNIQPNSQSSPNVSSSTESLHQVHQFDEHPMLIMANTSHSTPKALLTHIEPTSVKQALSQPSWLHDMQLKYDALLAKHAWKFATLSPHRKLMGCK